MRRDWYSLEKDYIERLAAEMIKQVGNRFKFNPVIINYHIVGKFGGKIIGKLCFICQTFILQYFIRGVVVGGASGDYTFQRCTHSCHLHFTKCTKRMTNFPI